MPVSQRPWALARTGGNPFRLRLRIVKARIFRYDDPNLFGTYTDTDIDIGRLITFIVIQPTKERRGDLILVHPHGMDNKG